MKKLLFVLSLLLLSVSAADAANYGPSTINPVLPTQNSPLTSAPVRNNFSAAYNDINNIYSILNNVSGVPSGTYGQIQWNNNGLFAGFTMAGDCTVVASTGVITCTKSNGTSFGTGAFANTGTSGATLPLLNGNNTFSGANTFNSTFTLGGVTGSTQCLHASSTGVVTGTGIDCGAGGGAAIGGTVTGGTAGDFLYINPASTLAQLSPYAAYQKISSGIELDPRNYGAACTGYYGLTTGVVGAAGSGFKVGDTFIAQDNNLEAHMRGGVNATGHITGVNGSGGVTSFVFDTPGSGYIGSDFYTVPTGGSTGINFEINPQYNISKNVSAPTTTLASGGGSSGVGLVGNIAGSAYLVGDTFAIPNSLNNGNYVVGRVDSVSSTGAILTYHLYNIGGDYTIATNVPAITLTGYGNGATFNITSNTSSNGSFDDTYGIVNALSAAIGYGGEVVLPTNCWVANLPTPTYSVLVGKNDAPHYGYYYPGPIVAAGARYPNLGIIETPAYGIDLNGQDGVVLRGFQIIGYTGTNFTGTYNSTTCIGSGTTNPISGQGAGNQTPIFIDRVSAKQCEYGLGTPTGGPFIFVKSTENDWGANNIAGIYGELSDFVSTNDTFASVGTGIWLVSSAGARIEFPRIEFVTTGIELDNFGALHATIDNATLDRITGCGIYANGTQEVEVTGGYYTGNGLMGTLNVTGAANNGSGLIRLTVSGYGKNPNGGSSATSGLVTGDIANVTNVGGTTEANGNQWTITVVDGTHIDLQGSTFTNAYTSGGYVGVNGKDAPVCLKNTNGFYSSNAGYWGYSGGNHPSAVVVDSTGSTNIVVVGNSSPQGGTSSSLNGYTQSFGNWHNSGNTIPGGTIIEVQGTAPIRNDNSVISYSQIGNVGIGTATPNANAILDLSGSTGAMILPKGTTGQEPTPVTGMLRYNSTVPQFEGYINGAWSGLGGISFPASGSIVVSTGTTSQSPSGLPEVDGNCVVGSAGAWTSGSCSGTSLATLGTSAVATSPGIAGAANNGFYTAGAGLVDVAIGSTKTVEWSSAGSNITNGSLLIAGGNGVSYPSVDTTAGQTIAIGSSALALIGTTSASFRDTAVGYQAMGLGVVTTAATQNTAVGYQAGKAITSGSQNTVIGANAGQNLTSGQNNICIGSASCSNYNGTYGVGIGVATRGAGNSVAIGYQSLQNNSSGTLNTAVGYNSGDSISTGGTNTIIGANVASTTLTTGSNNVLIGTNSGVTTIGSTTSNEVNIANVIYASGIGTSGTTPTGQVGIGTASPNTGVSFDLGSETNSMLLPTGTTSQRPTGIAGMLRYNSTLTLVEGYIQGIWSQFFTGSAGTPTCGTGCSSINSGSTDSVGSMVTGTVLTSATINWSTTLSYTPVCTISDNSTAVIADISAIGTTSMTVTFSSSISSVTVYYLCAQP